MFEKIKSKSLAGDQPPAAPQPLAPPAAAPPQQAAAPAAAPATASASAPASGGQRNILSNDVHINGSVKFTNDLLVDGRIEGKIASDGALTVAENAHIKAEVKTKSVVIYGKVHGNISCSERVDIKSSAEMVGDVKAGSLSIEPGAIFVGKSEVGTPTAQPQKEAPQNKASQQGKPQQQQGKPQQQQGNPQQQQGNNTKTQGAPQK
ncbi:MAG: polymer-forming cytoskeletal protein [Akkermansiaceae bacterium]|nr:polymer-forming cytoskeletal protein [Akkermansiaceae bacterium]MDG2322647.1 polymer-forming cytoskeletal protein [Akkermansiaceae bacterium]